MNTNEPGSSEETAATKDTAERPVEISAEQRAAQKAREAQEREAREREARERESKERESQERESQERESQQREGQTHGAQEHAGIEQAREVGAAILPHSVEFGGAGPARRLLLIGLDGATPELALGAWLHELPTLHMLTDRGARARLRSSTPWSTVPAWQSLLSGRDPGQLGVYGSRGRPTHSPGAAIDSRALLEPQLWELLAQAGKRVGVLGMPAGARLTDSAFASYPPALQAQVSQWLEDEPPPRAATTDDIDIIVGNAYALTEQRFRFARRLLARNSYDCLMLHDDGIATVQRALWHAIDVTHLRYTPDHPFAGAISAFYRFVDEQIGELLDMVDDETVVAVVAACGAQALDGELALNDWLLAEGDLVLHTLPQPRAALADCDVDWSRTRAWAGADGAIYLNVAGREPQGSLSATQIEQFSASLAARLSALAPPSSAAGGEHPAAAIEVYRPAQLYTAVRGAAPDLLAVCTLPGWRCSPLLGAGTPWLSTLRTPMDSACESPTGMCVLYDSHASGGHELADLTIYDIVPTLLSLIGQPLPAALRGRAVQV